MAGVVKNKYLTSAAPANVSTANSKVPGAIIGLNMLCIMCFSFLGGLESTRGEASCSSPWLLIASIGQYGESRAPVTSSGFRSMEC
jgi:hypothetical protein